MKDIITNMRKIFKFLFIILEKTEKNKLGYLYTYSKLNKYNPLTWIFIFIAIPVSIWQDGFLEMKSSLKNIFKWQ